VPLDAVTAALTGLGLVLAALTAVWLLGLRLRDVSIVDIAWGPAFALLAWVYWWTSRVGPEGSARRLLVPVLVSVWAARLAWHILARHRGEDPRYRAMRDAHGPAFWWQSLFLVFWLQGLIAWVVAMPLFQVARSAAPPLWTAWDVAGLVLFAIGFTLETVGDWQLARFRRDPANRGRVLDRGLWRYTRHPNYFGDATLWWGFFAFAAATPAGWMTLVSPTVMTVLLLKVSGVTLLERNLEASKPAYRAYVQRTSAFVPWPPRNSR
jgi:steroid 5-alpha reductase family enzyme